jgi:haloacetate dehalogenase
MPRCSPASRPGAWTWRAWDSGLVCGGIPGGRALLLHGHPQTHAIWRDSAEDVDGGPFPGGHYMAEEAPERLLGELDAFF